MNTVNTPNGIFYIDVEDCWIRNHMSSGKVFEHHIINGMLKQYVENSKYVVDVGANIGCHAISYAGFSPDIKIWAFEPQEKLYNILTKNVQINKYNDRITLYRNGLGHRNMTCNMAGLDTADKDILRGGCNKGGLGIGKGGEEIMVTTLDSYELPGLDFIKIDVEGAEGLVIKGGEKTISKYKPIICFEHNYQKIDPSVVGLKDVSTPFEELVKLGYKRFEYLDWDNYLAFPNDNKCVDSKLDYCLNTITDEINLGIYESKKFSQFGEDLFIVEFFANQKEGKYVDLGAFHPMRLSNTYLLYKKGWSGTNIDLNPITIDLFNLARKDDHNICCLMAGKENLLKDVYFEDWSAANSITSNKNLSEKKQMKTRAFESLIYENFDFLNIDLEGHDYEILQTIDFRKFNPKLICIEILENCLDKENIFNFLKQYNYSFIKNLGPSYFFRKVN